ncbi:MAG: dockerin type I domain-containing protein, partial [Planctomycetota bacterium]
VPVVAGHGRGYVIYGVAGPQGTLSIDGSSAVLAGETPTAGNFGTARLQDIDVVTGDAFTVRLNTNAVTLPTPAGESAPVRDVHADGDTALLRINDGVDLNGNGVVDVSTPGDVAYGFEEFTGTRTPGYLWDGSANIGTGDGLYAQEIDATQLAEGRHFVTVRAFRHRDAGTGGDGGPAVFTDFTRTIYVDRLPPESAIASFEAFASDPGNPNNRDLIIESVDQTANSVHYFFDEPAATTDAELIARAQQGQGATGGYDRHQWIAGITGVTTGNHAVTIVSFEPTGNVNVQRFAGVFTQTNLGLGTGDLSADGFLRADDLVGPVGLQTVLLSQNTQFNAGADADGNGLIDNRDLFAILDVFQTQATDTRVFPAFEQVLLARADLDGSGTADAADLALIYANLGGDDWLLDLDVDGVVSLEDARVLVTQLLRTSPADFNLDGTVDAADYAAWRNNLGGDLAQNAAGDANYDGQVTAADLDIWLSEFGASRQALGPLPGATAAAPEPSAAAAMFAAAVVLAMRRAGGGRSATLTWGPTLTWGRRSPRCGGPACRAAARASPLLRAPS